MRVFRYFTILLIAYSLQLTACQADTINTKDGKEIKGIVVEDYNDRIVLSTASGEVALKKADIEELYFDNEEENLIKLAEQAYERRDFARAFTYYNMALKVNPASKAANDGLVFLQGYLFRKEEAEKLDDIKRRENIERYGTVIPVTRMENEEERFKSLKRRLWEVIGLSLGIEKGFPKVIDVRTKSPAYAAGIRKNDLIVGVWAKLTGYLSLVEIMEMLLDKPSLEIRCLVERAASVDPEGVSFGMELKGLTVIDVAGNGASESGLKKDDLIMSINGESTRYMPLKKALGLIKRSRGGVNLIFRRVTLIWRGE